MNKNPFLKAQAAIEFLMTYGWAILIVVIVVGALFALGLTSPCKWVGTQVREFADFKVEPSTIRFDTAGATDSLAFDLSRLKPESATLTTITVAGDAAGSLTVVNNSVSNSTAVRHTVTGLTGTKAANDCYTVDVTLTYTLPTAAGTESFTSAGKISGIAS